MSRELDIQGMIDELAIRDLAVRYCSIIDRRDFDRLDEVYAADATADLSRSGPLAGVSAIIDVCRRGLAPLDATHHMVANHEITVSGDLASHRCYVHAQHVRHDAEGGPNYLMGGRYEDQLVRLDQGWRIKHRDLIVTWTEGNPGVLRPDRHDS